MEILGGRKNYISEHRESMCDAGLYIMSDIYSVPGIHPTCGNKHLFGYFQSAEVISGIVDELRDAFTVKTPPSAANKALLEEIMSCNAVCLHVRRGDYSQYPQLQVCGADYFSKAHKQAREVLDNPVFYVFSTGHSDIEWVRQHYNFGGEVRYVDLDNDDYEEIRLMMNCKHFIISNSTFSWWAAVLSNAACKDKRVWAPDCWLRGSDVKMTLPSWEIVS